MNLKPLYFLLIIFTLCVVNKSYAQREIHPLESMFTYEYALKYYANAGIRDFIEKEFGTTYFFLDNFKAPLGIKSIERISKYYYYNQENGFLEKSIEIARNEENEKSKEEKIIEYSYRWENGNVIIKTSENIEYTFSASSVVNKSNLLRLVTQKDTIDFSYSRDGFFLTEINTQKQSKKFTHTHSLAMLDKIQPTFWYGSGKYKPKSRPALTHIFSVFEENETMIGFTVFSDYHIEMITNIKMLEKTVF